MFKTIATVCACSQTARELTTLFSNEKIKTLIMPIFYKERRPSPMLVTLFFMKFIYARLYKRPRAFKQIADEIVQFLMIVIIIAFQTQYSSV